MTVIELHRRALVSEDRVLTDTADASGTADAIERRMRVFATAAAVAAFTVGCGADRASFRPTTHVTASGHGGQPAASYDVRVDSRTVAQVNIWSRGAYRDDDLQFAMPQPIDPDRIGALRLRWGLGYDDGRRYIGRRYIQFTEFQRVPERTYASATACYHPVFGFYDPFIHGPPYIHHYRYRVSVRRVIVVPRRPHDGDERRAERPADRRR